MKSKLFSKIALSAATLSLALVAPVSFAAAIKSLDAASLPGEKVELALEFDGEVPTPKGYTIEQPARISIDLPGATSDLGSKYNEIGFGNARSVTVIEAKDRTRLVVNLDTPSNYTTRTVGNRLYILIGAEVAASKGLTAVPSSDDGAVAEKRVAANLDSITNIDFQRGEGGEGNVIVSLSNANVALDMNERAGRIELRFPGTELPKNLQNRLDVIDFATPVSFIDASSEKDGAVIIVEPKGSYDYLAYQTDNTLTVSVKPLSVDELEKMQKERFSFTGEKLSLNFQDIDVRSVLQLIADFTDLNLVASDTVGGNITLRLQNVPWDQALDLVLKAKGLDKRKVGNVLMVAPAEEIAAREKQELENSQQISELAPTFSELMEVNYADANEVAAILKGSGDSGVLSDRGSVQVVQRTNSLLLNDTQAKLDELRDLVKRIDIPVKQVMIEARIVNAETQFGLNLGVKWSGGKVGSTNSSGKNTVIGGSGTTATSPPSAASPNPADNSFLDLGAAGFADGQSAAALAIGFATNSTLINLELSALESSGKGEVISQPKVFTADKTTARIESGTEIPYQEASSSGATSTSFKKAVLSLEVTPQITPDGNIIMDIAVNNDSPDVSNSPANGEIAIRTQKIETQVLVADGTTIVLGGIFQNNNTTQVTKVPFLGDVPYLGQLFRSTSDSVTKSELLVFITPKIIDNGLTLR
ncbi:type IV pilus secretin PilQ [Aestuariirhabdus litorea]|uniref:Type IV pilus secretin PilQ n=2 Tax=Aestuariirhabdus litorea TaxID=2528527 RepID=A0A3P3VMG0_9GAMM|nr:type IV pilus secretin PilQ [Aestuariirhabdus litorea]RWW93695.1 type IV pilus secretin PilQ [Endozoicomonadaceae bacterium GTF-13]